MYLNIVEPLFLILGLIVYLSTLGAFIRRTGNYKAVLRFWEAEIAFTHREFIINRIGIVLMAMGLVLRVFNHV